jgi:hypothetical protein
VVASVGFIWQPLLSTARMVPMTESDFHLVADVSSDDLAAIEPVLRQIVGQGLTETSGGFHIDTTMTGPSARDLNRSLLSALRRVERRTRLRAEWTGSGISERYFDYALKSAAKHDPQARPG